MTKQTAFNRVWKWFVVKGNKKSCLMDGDQYTKHCSSAPAPPAANCMYRGPDGARCGVGVLIPDSLYTEEMDTLGGITNPEVLRMVSKHLHIGRGFLEDMQQCHDNVEPGKGFSEGIEISLRRFASGHSLNIPNS